MLNTVSTLPSRHRSVLSPSKEINVLGFYCILLNLNEKTLEIDEYFRDLSHWKIVEGLPACKLSAVAFLAKVSNATLSKLAGRGGKAGSVVN